MIRTAPATRQLSYRFITIILGAILLAAGVFKGIDLEQFALQIRQYGILPDDTRLAVTAAWCMVVVEMGLGAALVSNWRPKVTLSGTILLLLVFIGALSWAMVHGGVSDCGCFGPAARRSPTEAMIEDVMLLFFAIAAWRLKDRTVYYRHPMKSLTVATTVILAMGLPVAVGTLHGDGSASASRTPVQTAGMILKSTAGDQVDLGTGTVLVALMDTDCNHCRESVPMLNEIAADAGDAITVCAVAANDPSEINDFIEENFTFYPVLSIDEKDFASLMDDGPLPQYVLIKNGNIHARWKNTIPDLRALIDLATAGKGA